MYIRKHQMTITNPSTSFGLTIFESNPSEWRHFGINASYVQCGGGLPLLLTPFRDDNGCGLSAQRVKPHLAVQLYGATVAPTLRWHPASRPLDSMVLLLRAFRRVRMRGGASFCRAS